MRILIVEDEQIEALDIRHTLRRLGYDVTGIAASADECMAAIAADPPDLVLMDIQLKGETDGIEVASSLRRGPEIPVVYLTSHSDAQSLRRATATEPYGYIIKPFSERDLHTVIETAIFRSRADRRIRESEMRYRTLFERSRDAIVITDPGWAVIDANPAMEELAGYGVSALKGKPLGEILCDSADLAAMADAIAARGYLDQYELRLRRSDGTAVECLVSATGSAGGEGESSNIQAIIRDITEWNSMMSELTVSREAMRNLSAHIEMTREKERKAIALEIHDTLGQAMTALKMDLTWMRHRLPADREDLAGKTESMFSLIDHIIDDVRRLSADLRPGILDDLGLCAAIEWYAGEFQDRTGISCNFRCSPDDIALDETPSVVIYRILQECLTNVIRHAQAREVSVSLVQTDGRVLLTVADDGRGITPQEIASPSSLGLMGMRERASSCGGMVEVTGSSGVGTTVSIHIPLSGGPS